MPQSWFQGAPLALQRSSKLKKINFNLIWHLFSLLSGAVAGISEGSSSLKGVAWVTPLVIGFVIVVAMIATAALVYVRKAANTNSTINSAKFPVNLTPVLFSGRGDPVKKNSTTPTFREFQVNWNITVMQYYHNGEFSLN